MVRDEHINAAVAQGIITSDQAQRLRALAQDSSLREALPADPDDERFRLIGGFNDVFVTIGVGLLVAALFALASVLEFRIGFAALAMVAAWGLSEIFSRRMRLALPSIALAIMFAGAGSFMGVFVGGLFVTLADRLTSLVDAQRALAATPAIFAGLGAAAAALIHERRFHVPVDWAIAAAGLTYAIAHAVSFAVPGFSSALLFAILGTCIFIAALRVDASDRERQTRRSDIAFWLHLVAAPMVVHGGIQLLVGSSDGMGTGQALAVLAIFVLLGLVAIVIDRRALLVSGLTYAGVAMGYLLSQGVQQDMGLSLTLLGLAVVVLGLSAGWRSLRRAVLPLLPLGSLRHSIPPPA